MPRPTRRAKAPRGNGRRWLTGAHRRGTGVRHPSTWECLGIATYHGETYWVIWRGRTRFGARVKVALPGTTMTWVLGEAMCDIDWLDQPVPVTRMEAGTQRRDYRLEERDARRVRQSSGRGSGRMGRGRGGRTRRGTG